MFTRICASIPLIISLFGCATTSSDGRREPTDTERARMLVAVANGALTEGDPTGALQHLAKATELDSSLPELHHSKALAYFAKHDTKIALAEAHQAVALAPTYTDAQNTLGKLLMDEGRYEEAETHLMKAVGDSLYREAFKPHTNLGILYYRKGEYSKARTHLSKAVDELPAGACIAHYYLGHVSLRDGKLQESQREYEFATQKLCARFGEAHLALGMLFEKNRNYDGARKKYLDIKQNFPNTKIAEQAMERLRYLP